MSKGLLVSFEGGEGSGKGTQIPLAVQYLESLGFSVKVAREPGGVRLGEDIRVMLLDPNREPMEDVTELLLYNASRHELIRKLILPSLETCDVLIVDRFYDSTTAYQGFARGIDLTIVQQAIDIAVGDIRPYCTIYLDIDPVIGLARAIGRDALDRLEKEGIEFHQKVREGFLWVASQEPERVKVVDGSPSIEEVHSEIRGVFSLLIRDLQEGR